MNKKTKLGKIIAHSGKNTVKVEVNSTKKHPKYHKKFKVTKKFLVHISEDKYQIGDAVLIEETKPMSRKKYFKVTKKLTK